MKPSWKDAPHWAKYLAADKNGTWYWYKKKPKPDSLWGHWVAHPKDHKYELIDFPEKPEWESTLEKRPE